MSSPDSSPATDPLRSWFEAVESLDEFIGIRFGQVDPNTGEVEWSFLPHTDFDGIGGLAHLLRKQGAPISELPKIPHPASNSWWPALRMLPKMLGPRNVVRMKDIPAGEPLASANTPAPAVAWHLFNEKETLEIRQVSRHTRVTVNSYLLRYLDRAVRTCLADPSEPIPWMVPVNLRGKVTQPSDEENHSSYVAIRLKSSCTPDGVHATIYDKLRRGEHWANWKAYASGRILSLAAKQKLIRTNRAMSQWNIGSFSNLGVWDGTRSLSGTVAERPWLFAPPVLRCQPLGVGCVTFRGRLSLTLQAHPDLTTDPAVSQGWLDEWVRNIKLDFPSTLAHVPETHLGQSPSARPLPTDGHFPSLTGPSQASALPESMKNLRPLPSLVTTLVLLGASTPAALAVGFRLPNQDPVGIARGNAFVATADNPSAIYFNPAGITQLEGHNLSLGIYAITTDIEFDNGAGGTAQTDQAVQVVPQIHYVYSPDNSPWSYGLGLYAPYGLGMEWKPGSPFTTKGQEAMLLYASFNPVIAYQVNPCLSVAAGLTVNFGDVEFINALAPGGVGRFQFNGDDLVVGFNLGLLYQPTEQWSFGLSYRGETEMDFEGTTRVTGLPSTSTTANLTFPMYLDVGVSYKTTPEWNFEVNVDWTDWDSVDVSTFRGTPFGIDVDLPFNYESSFMYEFGVTRYLEGGYFISTGYIYSENSAPDATLNPLNPDSDLHLWGFGVGKDYEDWGWAFGYHFAYNGGRTVSGNLPSPAAETANGRFKTFNHAVNMAYRKSF